MVPPIASCPPEMRFAKSDVPLAFVNVKPPLNARSVVVALFGSLISLYYYLIVLKLIFQAQTVQEFTASPTAHSALSRVTIALAATIVLCLGIAPQFRVARILAALP